LQEDQEVLIQAVGLEVVLKDLDLVAQVALES
jgi:hypothetical protein